jgi:hypothetical protein
VLFLSVTLPFRKLVVVGTTLAAAIAVFAVPVSASAAEPQRCHVFSSTNPPGAFAYDWLCGATATATYTQITDGADARGYSLVYRSADMVPVAGAHVSPVARAHWVGNQQIWESMDGFGTRTWSSPEPGYWIDQPGSSWLDSCQDCA